MCGRWHDHRVLLCLRVSRGVANLLQIQFDNHGPRKCMMVSVVSARVSGLVTAMSLCDPALLNQKSQLRMMSTAV